MAETALGLSDAEIDMLNGDPLTVDGGSAVTLTDTGGSESSVTVPDILAENGVIHVIDGVLLPESITNP
jgi:transforming growth factor-beta-induced protein